jgi:hypothetical protein
VLEALREGELVRNTVKASPAQSRRPDRIRAYRLYSQP